MRWKPVGRQTTILSPEAVDSLRWELQIRAWTYEDWIAAAAATSGEKALHQNTVINVMSRRRAVDVRTIAALHQAFKDHPPIPGLAELLRPEGVVAS